MKLSAVRPNSGTGPRIGVYIYIYIYIYIHREVGRTKDLHIYIYICIYIQGADKSLARPGRKQATATEDFDFHISYL